MKHRERHPIDVEGCFGCHVTHVDLNFCGVPGGREDWHEQPSLQAREKQALADARAGGIEPERYTG